MLAMAQVGYLMIGNDIYLGLAPVFCYDNLVWNAKNLSLFVKVVNKLVAVVVVCRN